ncbi:MAG TPA: sugar transferase [Ohtaekwangia sp.]|uniref:sugar transferase n=1 Tax=Ohtaekwangia sp. TaxID=2066019 RepID=UPI002F95C853
MDVAVNLNVNESPLSVVYEETKAHSLSFTTKNIVRIGFTDSAIEHDYAQEKIHFINSTLSKTLADIKGGSADLDAILINPASVTPEMNALKEIASQKAIPYIFYTPKFDQAAKDLALRTGVDEYHYGAVTPAFFKRIDFIKKLKVYKIQRGNKPYTMVRAHEEVPTIKLWTLKRAFDIIISLGALLCLSPLLIAIAVLIKLESKGSVFYISKRAGAGYKIFNFYKFRSMRMDADKELQKLQHLNQYAENSTTDNVFFKLKNDPRVTRIGQFIRNTSLDEIPQLFNVLKGDMSLVGNRPLPLYEAEKLTKDQIAWRFLAPAGITGLWQVTKRGKQEMSPEERIALDMEYAMKNSFWLDMKILLSTVPALLQKEQV